MSKIMIIFISIFVDVSSGLLGCGQMSGNSNTWCVFSDIEKIKMNILDSLPELLDKISINVVKIPLLSTGIVSCEELDTLRSHHENSRTETLQFVKLVLHRGEEAIRIFANALENSYEEHFWKQPKQKTNPYHSSEGMQKNHYLVISYT